MLFTEQHRAIADTTSQFIEREINPHADEWEAQGGFPAHQLFKKMGDLGLLGIAKPCLLYTSPSPRDVEESRMPSSA